jgi:nitrogenase-associated protein
MNFNIITFFEKPGCSSNHKQKKLLKSMGLNLQVVSLLQHPFTKEELLSFFSNKPLKQWFNPNAPKIKNNEIQINELSEEEAIFKMLKEPILIHRPLLIIKGKKILGFDTKAIEAALGMKLLDANEDIVSCVHG